MTLPPVLEKERVYGLFENEHKRFKTEHFARGHQMIK